MSVNDVTSGILAPALQVKRLQKREPNQKLWRRSQANKNRCVGIFKRRDIIFNRLHFPILIKFMLCDTSSLGGNVHRILLQNEPMFTLN